MFPLCFTPDTVRGAPSPKSTQVVVYILLMVRNGRQFACPHQRLLYNTELIVSEQSWMETFALFDLSLWFLFCFVFLVHLWVLVEFRGKQITWPRGTPRFMNGVFLRSERNPSQGTQLPGDFFPLNTHTDVRFMHMKAKGNFNFLLSIMLCEPLKL